MHERLTPETDPRTVDELINAALSELDEDKSWAAISALHFRGTVLILTRAETLCASVCPRERRLGADILGQLGVPDRSYPTECKSILANMLAREDDATVLQAVLVALSHLPGSSVRFARQGSRITLTPTLRYSVVFALTGCEDPIAVKTLLRLTTDSDVRDWATFGLGSQLKLDTPEIRTALIARLDDPDDDTRGEAMIGLARRKDQRVIGAIERDLSTDATEKAIEAAELIASPSLLPSLMALRESLDGSPRGLDRAINACQP